MATFAEIDDSKKVIRVLVVDDKDTQDADGNEVEAIGVNYLSKFLGGTWLKTDKYTRGGVHVKGGTPFRKNYGGRVLLTMKPEMPLFPLNLIHRGHSTKLLVFGIPLFLGLQTLLQSLPKIILGMKKHVSGTQFN